MLLSRAYIAWGIVLKKFAVVTAIVLLVFFAALLVFLMPAHLQVRKVEPALPSVESLRGLLHLENTPARVSFVASSSQQTDSFVLGHSSVLVEWSNGDIVMIDAGMDETAAIEFGKLIQSVMGGGEPEVHGTIASLLGERIMQVKAVGFTHLHIDHTQGILNFCATRGEGVRLLQSSYQRDLHNFNTTEGAELVSESCLEPTRSEGSGLISFDQYPGLAMYPLGGHTPGSTLFAVADGDRLLLFSGDITNSKADLIEDRPKPLVYSYLMVPENTKRTALLRDWLGELDDHDDIEVVVSHDVDNMRAVLQAF